MHEGEETSHRPRIDSQRLQSSHRQSYLDQLQGVVNQESHKGSISENHPSTDSMPEQPAPAQEKPADELLRQRKEDLQELNDHLRNEDIDSERVLSKLRLQDIGSSKIKEVDEMSEGFDEDG